MNYLLRVAVLAICVLSSPGARADAQSEIAAALDYYVELWNEGDFEALRGYYHGDFKLITPNGILTLEQRFADLKGIAERGGDRGVLDYRESEIIELGEKHAVAYGQITLRFKDDSTLDGWFSTVYVNTPFGWKALLSHE